MLKGFKEFLSRGNVIDLAVAVVIGAAFTGLVTSFTEKVVQPLVDRVGAGGDREYGFLKISLGGTPEQFVDFNAVLAAFINFLIVAAVIYFVIVLPYKKLRERGEVEQAQDTELSILTEIRDLLAANGTVDTGKHVSGTGPSPDTAKYTSADRDK
ncbi:large-conductance mechanosensitive channel protein MscL [Mycolicibacterium fortuitum]|uniref:large-conductance mechanosensitive channel protein MscL n=1 Tax=Mycolicibacterium fortuitum TaxID=1766 RepID=UPI0007EBFC3B|nr:large-conductance mechanosensitive channel protein MscL [Mycolicibacterium fortuitum]OBB33939.1 mechanosensitive ion channel protein MscL [Mycolicibacterium fortuitum]OBB47653.1 mechanosensitive ion channel protein MscL [Mycolicibacterium fortuitum]OBB65040.1 mechanosensitive ion channel protein MscL [Mycolicibacterium fortuitum]OBF66021.1 mechanosensitive ion channel protein MscL [Mycolicibacterium fortuitum]OBG08760.1 mechanosensitive ion channel protein MscL [Mycolicibacterium fortuitum]